MHIDSYMDLESTNICICNRFMKDPEFDISVPDSPISTSVADEVFSSGYWLK